jgi:hypothetical protein
MSVLTDDQVKTIAQKAAREHGVPVVDIGLSPAIALPVGNQAFLAARFGHSRGFFGNRFSGNHGDGRRQRR